MFIFKQRIFVTKFFWKEKMNTNSIIVIYMWWPHGQLKCIYKNLIKKFKIPQNGEIERYRRGVVHFISVWVQEKSIVAYIYNHSCSPSHWLQQRGDMFNVYSIPHASLKDVYSNKGTRTWKWINFDFLDHERDPYTKTTLN